MTRRKYEPAGGVNYVEAKVIDKTTREMFALTIQRCEGKTPHECRLEAEAELAKLRAQPPAPEVTDTERMDWLQDALATVHCNYCSPDDWTVTVHREPGVPKFDKHSTGRTLREALDNARAALQPEGER